MSNQFWNVSTSAQLGVALTVLAAACCGGIVGLERQLSGKRAGLRTHMLVSAMAATAVGLGRVLVDEHGSGDPTRVLHAVITGVGFIGAGAILQGKKQLGPSGLTTAATILVSAVFGAACGAGAPLLALICALGAVITLRGVHALEDLVTKIHRRGRAPGDPSLEVKDELAD